MCSLQPLYSFTNGVTFSLSEGGKKRLKGESSILAWFHFPSFLSFWGHVFVIVNPRLIIEGRILKFVYVPGHIFSFIKSRSLKIRKKESHFQLRVSTVRRAVRPHGRSRQQFYQLYYSG